MFVGPPALCALQLSAEDCPAAFEFCRDGGFLGVGWGVGPEPLDWLSYERRAIARDGVVHAAVQAIHDLPTGTLIWTRDTADRVFYLAKVTGPWRYLHGQAASCSDVQNVRPVTMLACDSPSQVPPTIAGSFVGSWVIQRIYDQHTACWSASLFDQLSQGPGQRRLTLAEVLTSCLDDSDVEDLVCTYLQRRLGYLVRPPARRLGVIGPERVLRDGFQREAIVRARRGSTYIPRDAASILGDTADRIYVFSPTATYGPDPAPNVTALEYDDIIDFIRTEPQHLPRAVKHWVSRALGDEGLVSARQDLVYSGR